jgi:hypothetical protein
MSDVQLFELAFATCHSVAETARRPSICVIDNPPGPGLYVVRQGDNIWDAEIISGKPGAESNFSKIALTALNIGDWPTKLLGKDQAGGFFVTDAGLGILSLDRVRDYLHEQHCRNPRSKTSIGLVYHVEAGAYRSCPRHRSIEPFIAEKVSPGNE